MIREIPKPDLQFCKAKGWIGFPPKPQKRKRTAEEIRLYKNRWKLENYHRCQDLNTLGFYHPLRRQILRDFRTVPKVKTKAFRKRHTLYMRAWRLSKIV